MTPNQKAFIESVVSMDNGKNRPVLETALKLYVMNEGVTDFLEYLEKKRADQVNKIFDDSERFGENAAEKIHNIGHGVSRFGRRVGRAVKSAIGRAGQKIMEDPLANNMPETPVSEDHVSINGMPPKKAKAAVDSERLLHTWEIAYPRFLQACDFVEYFLKTYGNDEIMKIINSPDFKESIAIGDDIDRIRTSPMYRELDRVRTYEESVEATRTPENSSTIDTILSLFETSESCTAVIPLVESAMDSNIMSLHNELAVIRNFNANHGSAPWHRWYNLHRHEIAMGSRKPSLEQPIAPPHRIDDDED